MSRNGSGVWQAPSNSWNPAVAGSTVDPTDWAAFLADLTTAISTSIASDGQTAATAIVPFAYGIDISASTGGQVKFPATQNASSNANTLDDYEEGSWTPADNSGAGLSFTVASCTYIKIGQKVTVSGSITFPATADTSNVSISGLPYTARTGSSVHGGGPSFTDTNFFFMMLVANNDTRFVLYGVDGVRKTNANMSGHVFTFNWNYFAAA